MPNPAPKRPTSPSSAPGPDSAAIAASFPKDEFGFIVLHVEFTPTKPMTLQEVADAIDVCFQEGASGICDTAHGSVEGTYSCFLHRELSDDCETIWEFFPDMLFRDAFLANIADDFKGLPAPMRPLLDAIRGYDGPLDVQAYEEPGAATIQASASEFGAPVDLAESGKPEQIS